MGFGDAVLCEIARRLKEAVRESDTVARLGGDEFAVISRLQEPWQPLAEVLARRLLAVVEKPISTASAIVRITASIGLALCPTHGIEPDALLHAADVAMYGAKKSRRGTYRLWGETTGGSLTNPASPGGPEYAGNAATISLWSPDD